MPLAQMRSIAEEAENIIHIDPESEIAELKKKNSDLLRKVAKLEKDKRNIEKMLREWYVLARNLAQEHVATDDKSRWFAGLAMNHSVDAKDAFKNWIEKNGPSRFSLVCPKARFLKRFLASEHR